MRCPEFEDGQRPGGETRPMPPERYYNFSLFSVLMPRSCFDQIMTYTGQAFHP